MKNNAKKRSAYDEFIQTVPLLSSLNVNTNVLQFSLRQIVIVLLKGIRTPIASLLTCRHMSE